MSTAIDLTFNCNTCNGDIAAPDIVERNSLQWRCPNCGDWSNWMKFTKEPNEVIEPITPQGNISDMGKAILAQAKALGIKVVEVDPKDLMGYLTSPSNSKYNVSDMQGNPVPDEVVAGNLPPWHEGRGGVIDHSENISPELFKKFCDEIKTITQPGKWDLRDEDGDLHSPAWYLDAFITARETYHEAREKVANCNDDSFDGQLDDAYYELELYGTYINRLFGSDLVEGEWNKSEDEDE